MAMHRAYRWCCSGWWAILLHFNVFQPIHGFLGVPQHHPNIPITVQKNFPIPRRCHPLLLRSTTPTATSTELDPNELLPRVLLEEIQEFVHQRSQARWQGDYTTADALKEQLLALELPFSWELKLEDFPRSQGGGSTWKMVPGEANKEENDGPSILQLARSALGWAVFASQTMMPPLAKRAKIKDIVETIKTMLQDWKQVQEQSGMGRVTNTSSTRHQNWQAVEFQLRGRKAADAAFWLAMSGVADNDVIYLLSLVVIKELHRFGHKPSCRAKDIYQMLDRFAGAGLLASTTTSKDVGKELEAVARECLIIKQGEEDGTTLHEISNNLLDLHSDRCLLMLWKFSARQTKQQSFLQSAQLQHWNKNSSLDDKWNISNNGNINKDKNEISSLLQGGDNYWSQCFDDPIRPLVIDIGCGMGISLLGLASQAATKQFVLSDTGGELNWQDYQDCNFLGVDLSGLAVGYAQGITERWGLNGILQWEVDTAESLLDRVRSSYPGPVVLCLIQFPTPFQLQSAKNEEEDSKASIISGNSQLPQSPLDGFMVSPELLKSVHDVLSNQHVTDSRISGKLLLQSNCEDVALWMQQTATVVGLEAISMTHSVNSPVEVELPLRTQNWIAMGGARAVGNDWSSVSLLPSKGCTETEVACRINRTPVHRCLLRPANTV